MDIKIKRKIEQISSSYTVKIFSEKDISDIYTFCKENTIYYKYMKMEPTFESLTEVLTALPPKTNINNKFFIGFYNKDRLITILDLVLEYPNKDTAYIGWFMMNKEYQGLGIGTEIMTEILYFLKKEKFSYVQLGYIKENKEAKFFWEKNRFIPNGIESETDQYTIVMMQREV